MILIYSNYLVTRNSRDKIQVAHYSLYKKEVGYIIKRYTGQFLGKMTEQPSIEIIEGKAKRSPLQQAELEYNSIIKKSLDKGYKKLSVLTKTKYENITSSELDNIVPSTKTDQNGNIKHQLAKDYNKCPTTVFDKPSFCSRKLNGVRCSMRYNPESKEIKSVSRGGGNYDGGTLHIRNNENFIKLFEKNPDLILDGELYVHGLSLQKISGLARLENWEEKCKILEYWVYDIVDLKESFSKRLDNLVDLEFILEESPNVKFVEHIYETGWSAIKKLHDKFVAEGFEGLVMRNPSKVYGPGKRNSDWIKVKDYMEDSFKILNWKSGLRGVEDMVFILETKNRKQFEAKPMGNREDKQEYVNDMKNIIGKLGDVKFFEYSDEGIPLQPTFIAVRFDL